ncbi:MAG TPA: hypothetical protein VMF90_14980 [Rhizobiaceae bacterium]|nr:hypothetical protein [Rhizobiaceae bacterium]
MKSKAASRAASVLIYAQGLLMVIAVGAVISRLPAEETRSAAANQAVVASITTDTVAQ